MVNLAIAKDYNIQHWYNHHANTQGSTTTEKYLASLVLPLNIHKAKLLMQVKSITDIFILPIYSTLLTELKNHTQLIKVFELWRLRAEI